MYFAVCQMQFEMSYILQWSGGIEKIGTFGKCIMQFAKKVFILYGFF